MTSREERLLAEDPTRRRASRGQDEAAAEVVRSVRQAMLSTNDKRPLAWTDTLRDLGVTSLRFVGLIIDLEERFGLPLAVLKRMTPDMPLIGVLEACVCPDELEEAPELRKSSELCATRAGPVATASASGGRSSLVDRKFAKEVPPRGWHVACWYRTQD